MQASRTRTNASCSRNLASTADSQLACRRIGAVYHDALRKLHGLLDGEKQDTIREAVRALKEESIQALVALGREREQLKDRKAVDDSLAREVQRTPFADFKALTAAVRSYRSSDNDFANLLASFNTLTQYACFELLQKQNPDEAARLKRVCIATDHRSE